VVAVGYFLDGSLPANMDETSNYTVRMHCSGHRDWFETQFYFGLMGNDSATADKLVVSVPDGENDDTCPDYPSWTSPPKDTQQLEMQLFLLAVFLLGSSWVGTRVIKWCRQRGWCLCLW
jgi:hypothetical protein